MGSVVGEAGLVSGLGCRMGEKHRKPRGVMSPDFGDPLQSNSGVWFEGRSQKEPTPLTLDPAIALKS
jgi:hypothetical protein